MTPYEALTEADKETILNYIHDVGGGNLPDNRLPTFLSSWNSEKEQLFQIFGEKLRLERPIVYNTPKKEIQNKVDDVIAKHDRFIDMLRNTINNNIPREDGAIFNSVYGTLTISSTLVDNVYPERTWQNLPYDLHTPQGNRIRIAAGVKPMRIIGKLAHAFGYEQEYEQFRIEISQALNVAHLEGNLCLSIHPMDYMTMSDNDCNWRSCMSWYHDGEYKLGTLEMLGSSYCVVAYLTSEEPYRFSYYVDDNNSWINKKWRQLLFIHPAFIVGNRNYPFDAPDIEAIAMEWLKELAENANFSEYQPERIELCNGKTERELFEKPFMLSLQMKEMYNDLGINWYYLAKNFKDYITKDSWNLRSLKVELSGDARCIDCGYVIDYTPDPRYLQCDSCIKGFECSCCGEFVAGDLEYVNSDGQMFCSYCLEESDYIQLCDVCDEYYTEGSLYEFDIDAPDGETLANVCACYNCKHSNEIVRLFGNFEGYTFQAENVSEEGHYILNNRGQDFDFEDLLEHTPLEDKEDEE